MKAAALGKRDTESHSEACTEEDSMSVLALSSTDSVCQDLSHLHAEPECEANCVHDSENELKTIVVGEGEEEREGKGDREEEKEEEEDNEHCHPLASNGLGSSEDLVSYKDTEKLVSYKDTEDLVSYKDTEKLVSQDAAPRGGTRTLYSNTKCCKTKTSILISKSVFLLVGVAVLLVGAVLAGTIRHHPTDDQCSNSSLEFSSTPLFPNPTRTSNHGDATPYLAITPSPTSGVTGSHYGLRTTTHNSMITPSPSSL